MSTVNGHKIREALRRQVARRDAAQKLFKENLWAFPGEHKSPPEADLEAFAKAEEAIADLQVAQQKFNLLIEVDVEGEAMPLAKAIKMSGSQGRLLNLMKEVDGSNKTERWMIRESSKVRKADDVVAQSQIDLKSALVHQERISDKNSQLRTAIATANAKEISIEKLGVSTDLFE